jgi:hypothetical protein
VLSRGPLLSEPGAPGPDGQGGWTAMAPGDDVVGGAMLECSDDELLATLGRNEAFAESNETRRAMLQEIAAGNYQLKITDPVGGHIRALGLPAIGELAWAIHERSWGLGTTHSGGHLLNERSGPCLVVPAGRSEPNHPECRVPSVPGEQRDHTGDAPTSPR